MDEQQHTSQESSLEQQTVQFLEGLAQRMSMSMQFDVTVDGRFLRVNITGEDVQKLVMGAGAAAKSDVLEAIQLILGRYLFPGEGGKTIVADADGFRDKRCDFLEGAADRLAETVLASGKSLAIYGMNSFDRRAIHLRLANRDDLKTDSEGEGTTRTLLILNHSKPSQPDSDSTGTTRDQDS